MSTQKLKVEVYQGDPFSGACCGPGTSSPDALEKMRRMLTERSRIFMRLEEIFRNKIQLEKEIVSPRRWDYPEHVRRLMAENQPLPYIFINQEAVIVGRFPSYEELVDLINSRVA